MITDQQVVLLRQKLMEGKTQQAAAAVSATSERSVRRWQRGSLPSERRRNRRGWRTRPDPFADVWKRDVEPLLRSDPEGELSATTILEWLDERYPGRFGSSQLRTLQRRVRDYRALHGPDREVYFQQDHPPGREAQVDFTHCSGLGVTIGGEPFRHLLFHLVLSYSGWSYAEVCFGETFAALVKGLQGALWELGCVPSVIRTDNLSAATHELRDSRGRAMNASYEAVLAHYGVEATRTNPRSSHENGVVEQRHRRLKNALDQALILRGSRDFESEEEYRQFVRAVVDRRNREAGDGAAAVRVAQNLNPDVIVMDVMMPLKNGIDACREITEMLPDTRVLMLTAASEEDAVMEAVAAGATGYLQKYSGKDRLLLPVAVIELKAPAEAEADLGAAICRV